MLRNCAIVGIGFSEFGQLWGASNFGFTLQACKRSIEDSRSEGAPGKNFRIGRALQVSCDHVDEESAPPVFQPATDEGEA